MLIGMGSTFATVAALSVAGGHWVIQANQIGRDLALGKFLLSLGSVSFFQNLLIGLASPFVRTNYTSEECMKNRSLAIRRFSAHPLGYYGPPCRPDFRTCPSRVLHWAVLIKIIFTSSSFCSRKQLTARLPEG